GLREQALVDALLGARRLLLENVGRIAHQCEHAAIADLGQDIGIGRRAEDRRLVDLPVAGVEDIAERRLDQQPVPFGDRMRERDEADLEGAELDGPATLDNVELDLPGEPFLLKLAGDQARGERRRVERDLQLLGEIGQRADIVLVPVGTDYPREVLLLVLDELEVWQYQVDAGISGVGEGQAEVDHDPLAAATVEIDVHADLARAAERAE